MLGSGYIIAISKNDVSQNGNLLKDYFVSSEIHIQFWICWHMRIIYSFDSPRFDLVIGLYLDSY